MDPSEKRHGPAAVTGPRFDSASSVAINGLPIGVVGVVQPLSVEAAPVPHVDSLTQRVEADQFVAIDRERRVGGRGMVTEEQAAA